MAAVLGARYRNATSRQNKVVHAMPVAVDDDVLLLHVIMLLNSVDFAENILRRARNKPHIAFFITFFACNP